MPFVQAGDLRLHYETAGDGTETLLLVHGWTGSATDWRPLMERLRPGFRAVAVDLRGAGQSDKPEGAYTIAQYAADLHAFAEALALPRFTIVGHSMGGTIAYQYAIDHGDRLRAAVFCAPAGADGYAEWTDEAIEETRKSRADRTYARESARLYYVRPVSDAIIEAGVDNLMAASEGHVYASINAMRDVRLGERLASISVPSLMIGGDRDAAIPLDMLLADFRRIPGCHLHVFYRTGHSMLAEVPDAFATTLFDFVQSLG